VTASVHGAPRDDARHLPRATNDATRARAAPRRSSTSPREVRRARRRPRRRPDSTDAFATTTFDYNTTHRAMTLFRIQRTVRSRVVASPSRRRVALARRSTSRRPRARRSLDLASRVPRPASRVPRPSRPARVARRRALADARASLTRALPLALLRRPFPSSLQSLEFHPASRLVRRREQRIERRHGLWVVRREPFADQRRAQDFSPARSTVAEVRAEDARGDARDLGRGLRDARHRGVV
jgi:hypothetical protein